MTKPNLLFILTDDQGAWALGSAGNREIHTPVLDDLAAGGMRFENFFCASPVCSPARASILTGRIPSQHGVHDWLAAGNLDATAVPGILADPAQGERIAAQVRFDQAAIPYLAGMSGWSEDLAAHGYTCALTGKWHMGDSLHPQKGYAWWRVIPYGGSDYNHSLWIRDGKIHAADGYISDLITGHALEFLETRRGEPGPFALSVHYTAPHSPWDAGQHPADLTGLYRDCTFESCPDLPEAHPWQINSAPRGTGARRIELLTGYFAAISGVDRGVGRLLAKLRQTGQLENTLVIFCGDNGMNMGHHGIWGKGNGTFPMNMYDTSVKVPFIASWPGHIPAGVREERLLSQYDIYPTLLDLCGLPPRQENLPGRSFAATLAGREDPAQAEERVVVFDEYGPVRMIRSQTWKYIHRYPYGPHELYDLANDPGEEHNRYGEEATRAVSARLRGELEAWFLCYVDPARDGAREGVTGRGQTDLAGVAGQGRKAYIDEWHYVDAEGRRRLP